MKTNEIFKYIILEASYTLGLASEVQQHIDQGWEPHGSMVIENGEVIHFFQPMVKYARIME